MLHMERKTQSEDLSYTLHTKIINIHNTRQKNNITLYIMIHEILIYNYYH